MCPVGFLECQGAIEGCGVAPLVLPQDLYRGFRRKGANIGSMAVGIEWAAVVDMLIAASFVVVETGVSGNNDSITGSSCMKPERD